MTGVLKRLRLWEVEVWEEEDSQVMKGTRSQEVVPEMEKAEWLIEKTWLALYHDPLIPMDLGTGRTDELL